MHLKISKMVAILSRPQCVEAADDLKTQGSPSIRIHDIDPILPPEGGLTNTKTMTKWLIFADVSKCISQRRICILIQITSKFGNVLVPNRWQAIFWANNGPVLHHQYDIRHRENFWTFTGLEDLSPHRKSGRKFKFYWSSKTFTGPDIIFSTLEYP